MQKRGSLKGRVCAAAAVALTLALVAPTLAAPAGAAPRAALGARVPKRLSPKARRALAIFGRTAKGRAALYTLARAAKARAAGTASAPSGSTTKTAVSPNVLRIRRLYAAKQRAKRAAAARIRLRAASRRAAARRAALRVGATRNAGLLGARANAKKKSSGSLSLPELALMAIAPFVLVGLGLLASDYYRRRPPKRRRASLVITRAGGR